MAELSLPWTKALVVGMGASGRAAAALLAAAGIEVHAYDRKAPDTAALPANARTYSGDDIPDEAVLGAVDPEAELQEPSG